MSYVCGLTNVDLLAFKFCIDYKIDKTTMTNLLVDIIKKSDNLNYVALAFYLLVFYGYNIKMFDFKGIEQIKT